MTELRAQSDQLRDDNVRLSRKKVQSEAEITRLQRYSSECVVCGCFVELVWL